MSRDPESWMVEAVRARSMATACHYMADRIDYVPGYAGERHWEAAKVHLEKAAHRLMAAAGCAFQDDVWIEALHDALGADRDQDAHERVKDMLSVLDASVVPEA